MNFNCFRSEVARRGWKLTEEHGEDAAPDFCRIQFSTTPMEGEATLFRVSFNWRCCFHGTMAQLDELHDVLVECGVA